jgi:hypothetical protein
MTTMSDAQLQAAGISRERQDELLKRQIGTLPFSALIRVICDAIKVEREKGQTAVDIRALREEIAALKEAQITFAGMWNPNRSYPKNALALFRGGLWLSKEVTAAKPGDGIGWQLVTKAGSVS